MSSCHLHKIMILFIRLHVLVPHHKMVWLKEKKSTFAESSKVHDVSDECAKVFVELSDNDGCISYKSYAINDLRYKVPY
jgi:hypothetical protein